MEQDNGLDWLVGLVGAALSFDFFHARPLRTLRIASGRDIVTVVLLAVLGIVVGEVARLRRTAARDAVGGRAELRLLSAHAELCRTARSEAEAILGSVDAIGRLLGADSVAFHREPMPADGRRIEPDGTLHGVPFRASTLADDLGDDPVDIDVSVAGRSVGHVSVFPTAGHPVTLDARIGAVVIADQLAVALESFSTQSRR